MSTLLLRDRVRSEKEWQSVELFPSGAKTKATTAAVTGAANYIGDWDKLMVILDITIVAGDATTDTFDVYVDMSMDNLAWYNVGHFTQWEGDTAIGREQMVFIPGTRYVADPNAIIIGSADLAETVVSNHLRGRYIRYRLACVDNDTNGSWTCSLMAMVYRNDIVRHQESEIKTIELFPLAVRAGAEAAISSDIWEIGDNWDWMQAVLRVTNHDTDATDHLDVGIYISVDGIDWIGVGDFTQCNGDDAAWVELMTFVPGLLDNVDATVVVTAAPGETVTRPGIVGPFLKAIYTTTEASTVDATFTWALKVYIK